MIRTNFFSKFLKYRKNDINAIVQYNSNKNFGLQEQIKTKIIEIDQKISENSKAIIQAQIIRLRSAFSKSNNIIGQIGNSLYKTKLEDSINWHQKELKELYLRRRELEITLEKLKGIFWLNRIKRFLKIIFIGLLIVLSLLIFLSGFMIVIYLLPVVTLILFVYLTLTKRY